MAPRFNKILVLLGLGLASSAVFGQSKEYIVRFTESRLPPLRGKIVLDDRYATQSREWGYLKPTTVNEVQRLEKRHSFRVKQAYSHALSGFSADLTSEQLAALRQEPSVDLIEEVLPTKLAQLDILSSLLNLNFLSGLLGGGSAPAPAPSPGPAPAPAPVPFAVPINVPFVPTAAPAPGPAPEPVPQTIPYGITLTEATQSFSQAGNGSGSVDLPTAYVIDSGIGPNNELNLVQHVNFAGGPNTDCNGHGTHVAGTIGARDNAFDTVGVAPGIKLVGVKALGCDGNGTTAMAIKAIDWVTANAMRPAVVNLSFTSAPTAAFDDAVRRSVASGLVYSLAAGNEAADACGSSPARVGGITPGVFVVAASDSNDAEANFSNFGSCIDIWAPGVGVVSTRSGGGLLTLSGTSMSAPHVAGAAALFLARNPQADNATVWRFLKDTAVATSRTSRDGKTVRRLRANIQ
ncbi:MAG: S8 family peptidase [Pseudomonadota bacterium]